MNPACESCPIVAEIRRREAERQAKLAESDRRYRELMMDC